MNTSRVSNSLNPDQTWLSVGPGLGTNGFQRSQTDAKKWKIFGHQYLIHSSDLTCFILMAYPVVIDTLIRELSILYFKGLLYFYKMSNFCPWQLFISKQMMLTKMKCRIRQYFILVLTVCQSICLLVSRMKRLTNRWPTYFQYCFCSNFNLKEV